MGLRVCAKHTSAPARRCQAGQLLEIQQYDNSGERKLTDIVADEGRPVRLRFSRTADNLPREEELGLCMDLHQAVEKLKLAQGSDSARDVFQSNNHMGIIGSLHRLSRLVNRFDDMYGITYRIGRHVPGTSNDC
ncbi:TPA: hypothetical protein ACH3X1_006821 [Trebouxia sp. C0004]